MATNLRRMTKRHGVKQGPTLYNNITNRNTAALLAQLRTEHCGLNKYLHRSSDTPTPYCQCGYGKETVEHYLMECKRYNEERREMQKEIRRNLGRGCIWRAQLLGGPKIIKFTMDYVHKTGRFNQSYNRQNKGERPKWQGEWRKRRQGIA